MVPLRAIGAMASVSASTKTEGSNEAPEFAGPCFEVGPWAGLAPQYLEFDSFDEIGALRQSIAHDLKLLAPRIAGLDARIGQKLSASRAYLDSKKRRIMDAPVRMVPPLSRRAIDRQAPTSCLPARIADGPDLASRLTQARRVLVVGAPGKVLSAQLSSHADKATYLSTAGRGERAEHRPGRHSLAWWLAMAGEAERAAVNLIVLTCQTGRADCEILRRRLAPHTAIACEHGSAAGAWLMSVWDGTRKNDRAVNIFSGPGLQFREVSRLIFPASGKHWPRISVVTTSFNQAAFLEDCLRSVVDQDYPNLEYIVLDPGSTDGSRYILQRYADRIDRLILEPDEGQSDGLNKGFSGATGDILTWINSDDMLAPGALRRAALAFVEFGVDVVAGTCERVGEDSANLLHRHFSAFPEETPQRFKIAGPINWHERWERGDYFFQPEVFFTRDIWIKSGAGLKRHLHWAMDWDLWLRCAAAGASIVRIPDVLGVSRVQAAQKTTHEEAYLPQLVGILDEFDQTLSLAQKWVTEPAAQNSATEAMAL